MLATVTRDDSRIRGGKPWWGQACVALRLQYPRVLKSRASGRETGWKEATQHRDSHQSHERLDRAKHHNRASMHRGHLCQTDGSGSRQNRVLHAARIGLGRSSLSSCAPARPASDLRASRGNNGLAVAGKGRGRGRGKEGGRDGHGAEVAVKGACDPSTTLLGAAATRHASNDLFLLQGRVEEAWAAALSPAAGGECPRAPERGVGT